MDNIHFAYYVVLTKTLCAYAGFQSVHTADTFAEGFTPGYVTVMSEYELAAALSARDAKYNAK